MDPQQELFTALLLAFKEVWGSNVYDGVLPPAGTPYPFVYLGDSQLIDSANKTAVFGEVTQTVHVFHNNVRQRGTVSGMLLQIKQIARALERTTNFGWMISDISQQILPDNTTDQPLLHGVLQITFRFS